MFANYQKRFSITSYGGNSFSSVTGFEQVVTNSIPTYYVIGKLKYFFNRRNNSCVIQFDQNWNSKQDHLLAYKNSLKLNEISY